MSVDNGAMHQPASPSQRLIFVGTAAALLVLLGNAYHGLVGAIKLPETIYLPMIMVAALPVAFTWFVVLPASLLVNAALVFLFLYVGEYGLPTNDALVAIMQTELGEASDFIGTVISSQELLYSAVFSVGTCLIVTLAQLQLHQVRAGSSFGPARFNARFLAYAGVTVAIVLFITGTHLPLSKLGKNVTTTLARFQQELDTQNALKEQLGDLVWPNQDLTSRFDGDLILVIGESTARHHLGLYGYHRDTTPYLDGIAGELLLQYDTISPHSHTVQSLSEMLSPANYDDSIVFHDVAAENLLVAAGSADFKTYWLSNQNKYGAWDNPISLMGQTADSSNFIRKSFGTIYDYRSYDHELLAPLQTALRDRAPNKLIFLHLYATHADYCENIPEDARHFPIEQQLGASYFGNAQDRSRTLNCYDNAVRYVDQLLGKVIDKARASDKPTIVAYISDHGEDPGGDSGHNSAAHRAAHIEIPHIWYFNTGAEQQLAAEVAAFEKNSSKPFKASDLYHSILHLIAEPSDVIRMDRSLFSDQYRPYDRSVLLGDADLITYDVFDDDASNDPDEHTRANLTVVRKHDADAWQKIWAHRVNTIGKLLQAKHLFSGVELDLVYDPGMRTFAVTHPPAEETGLTLETYLEASTDKPQLHYWFDWKNADAGNLHAALARLSQLDTRYKIRERTILEFPPSYTAPQTGNPGNGGWQSSYYLPTGEISACMRVDTNNCTTLTQRILQKAAEVDATYLSFDYRVFRYLKENRHMFSRYQWLSWNLQLDSATHDLTMHLPDESLSVLLINFKSPFHY